MFDFLKKALIASFIFSAWMSILLFLFFLNINPADLGTFLGTRIGEAVGTTINKASVADNPINKLALDLSKKEKELNRYEELLNEKEEEIEENSILVGNKVLITMAAAIGVLFGLIFLNFYLDYRRRIRSKRLEKQQGGQNTS